MLLIGLKLALLRDLGGNELQYSGQEFGRRDAGQPGELAHPIRRAIRFAIGQAS